jgi:hypothetical protein
MRGDRRSEGRRERGPGGVEPGGSGARLLRRILRREVSLHGRAVATAVAGGLAYAAAFLRRSAIQCGEQRRSGVVQCGLDLRWISSVLEITIWPKPIS